ncbi:30S ribosomal protein S15 [Candidatus Berkelbacteria bacterium CG_4_9_14_3_um_filter_39_23]|uniref:Small ribosomal subunit protein uS15 n=2 Tax=Candidatus Berkelbacteria TaxID=1618330 RepID=A0A2M7CIA3_9BACT|nr:30S ribosomal protein S15 [Candidatus Berkelbacteria bacterium]PIR27703.1 MAG: 30S ribosomal protein S15 [Candidatus Berkelbacteria bacterium CG11_big_fil_rev_8_21_14_0_20_40_23]PIV25374.1 MAG: 30S ribosomal protein S15 [Candidatus Berkelbacteria bacterium CG03_land_8_20_14_0_80_40_36]PIX30890.1 MAG: 30S ribosomal protein S15 [Candidatus Berkelbacteria bacterium CG_4_8_14_3_um_filter_39_27]PIZ29198.1 MAG: 30S ribosomal protein S15 [Candidatus Berkelbacteria bacterium CG_4_10_14_0_8_um_filter
MPIKEKVNLTKTESKTKVLATAKKVKTVAVKPTATKIAKVDLVKKYRGHKLDTGSIEVQIALFSQRIETLAKHLKKHSKDNDSMRGLLQMVGKRRRLLNYLKKKEEKKYLKLILDLGLRK